MNSRFRLPLFILALVALVAVFALAPPGEARAQGADNDYVDVAVILEFRDQNSFRPELDIIVVNNGSRAAYDVEVVVDVVSPAVSYFFVNNINLDAPEVPVGTSSLESSPGGTDEARLRWAIPVLGGLQRVEVAVDVLYSDSHGPPVFDNSLNVHEYFGEVTTASYESDRHKGNNASRVWSYRYDEGNVNRRHRQAAGNYTVGVSVDKPSPSPGDTVNFTITADRERPTGFTGFNTQPIDTKVDIELTDGLSLDSTGTITYDPSGDDKPDSMSYSNGVFTIGTLKAGAPFWPYSVTLPISVASDAVVNEQCLTATLTGNPPPGNGPLDDDISDNVAKLCLGYQPAEPFVSGELDIFTVYDCFARQTYPCDGTDGVRVRAVNNNARNGIIVAQHNVTVQVQDIQGRTYDSYLRNSNQQSVTGAETVSWQTGSASHANFTGTREGVRIFFSRIDFNGNLNNWVKVAGEHVTVTDLNGGDPPGDMYIRGATGSAFTQMKSSNDWTVTYSGTSSKTDQSDASAWFAEFSKLGTYVVDYTTIGNRDDTNGDCESELLPSGVTAAYCDTKTDIFHVGPMADLAVEDGGGSPHVAAGRNALTIIAVNDGPDDSPNSQVTGLPTGAEVIHIGQGTYDTATGEWDIGELKVRDYYLSRGEPDRTLVLSASAGDTADVSIANSENYEVCIGPKGNPVNLAHTTQSDCEAVTDASWNSTPVYDYKSDNNTATITAQAGTGGVGGKAPRLCKVRRTVAPASPSRGTKWPT